MTSSWRLLSSFRQDTHLAALLINQLWSFLLNLMFPTCFEQSLRPCYRPKTSHNQSIKGLHVIGDKRISGQKMSSMRPSLLKELVVSWSTDVKFIQQPFLLEDFQVLAATVSVYTISNCKKRKDQNLYHADFFPFQKASSEDLRNGRAALWPLQTESKFMRSSEIFEDLLDLKPQLF